MSDAFISVRVHTSDGLEYSTTMESSDADQLTLDEQTRALEKLANELKDPNGRKLNIQNLSVDQVVIFETDLWSKYKSAQSTPAMWRGVVNSVSPVASACPAPTSPSPAAVMSPEVPEGMTLKIPLSLGVQGPLQDYHLDLTPQAQMTEGGRTYDVYQAVIADVAQPARYRREQPGGAWEVEGPESQTPQTPRWKPVPPELIVNSSPTPPPPADTLPPAPSAAQGITVKGIPVKYVNVEPSETAGQFFQNFQTDKGGHYRRRVDTAGSPINGAWEKFKPAHGHHRAQWAPVNPKKPHLPPAPPVWR